MYYESYKMKRKENKNQISCPFCGEKFESEKEMFEHFVRSHEEVTKNLLTMRNNVDDWGYFFSCLVCFDSNLKTERWYNS